jgi:hypothetical protein
MQDCSGVTSILLSVHPRTVEPLPAPDSPRERILVALGQLDECEADVLALVAERLAIGRGTARYAPGPTRKPSRTEALEETADGLVYAAVALTRKACVAR